MGVSYLFLNVNGAGVRHGGCVAGKTRRHTVKAGAEAARGHAHERANGVTGGGRGGSPPANGSGTRTGSRHRAQCEGAVMHGAPRGFVPRRTEGWACLRHGGSRVPAHLLSGCRLLVQAAPSSWGRVTGRAWDLPARGLRPTTQTIRGYVVPLGRACTPKAGRLLPPARLSPVPRCGGSSEPRGPCKGTPRPRASAEASSEREQQKPAAC